jgi:hypothetical protein
MECCVSRPTPNVTAHTSPERLAKLYEQFHSITDDDQFTGLCEKYDLDVTNLNRLRRTLTEQLDEQDLHDAVYGRNPYRDPSLPDLGVGSLARLLSG